MAELVCEGISLRFGGLQALAEVDIAVTGGQVSGLIGPNGAGKTTLFNVITGIERPDCGRVVLNGADITRLRAARRAKLGLARTFQRIELFLTLTSRENVQMAAETQRARLPDGVTPLKYAEQLIDRIGLRSIANDPTDSLPTGQARLVELARALACNPSVLLLDEPSAGLDPSETANLGDVLRELAADGLGVLLVEHDMNLVMGVCDYVVVLDFGQIIAKGGPSEVKSDPTVQAAYLGAEDRTRKQARPPRTPQNSSGQDPQSELIGSTMPAQVRLSGVAVPVESGSSDRTPLLTLQDVRACYGRIEVVHGVSLSVPKGSVVALLGPNGAGKSSLLKVASGILAPSAGSVEFDGRAIRRVSAEHRARARLCTVPEGRAVFPNLTVAENLRMFTYRGRDLHGRDLEEQSYERFPVLGSRRKLLAGRLSGGEQQMLALCRALYTRPQMLILDELSMGLAPRVVDALYEAVNHLVERDHVTVLLVEQFATTALSIADEAHIMVNGRVVESGPPEAIGEHLTTTYLGVAT